jgi:hypothetical protein
MRGVLKFIGKVLRTIIGEDRLLHYVATGFNRTLIGLKNYGYLHEMGWVKSFDQKRSFDKNGKPLPWISYPALAFISNRLRDDLTMFEYGGGSSTSYFSKYLKEIHTAESDQKWAEELMSLALPNVKVYYESVSFSIEGYVNKPLQINKKFDLILVDGVHREECLKRCIDCLTPRGVVIIDDLEEYNYERVLPPIYEKGFRKIEFSGMSAMTIGNKTTAILYRDDNCFDI